MMDLFSESDCSSVSNSSMEQDDDIETLYGGQASNILTSLEETIGKIDDFLSFESEFSYGDVVCPSTDPFGQLGRVVNIDMFVDLEDLQGKKIKDVSSTEIQKIRSISVGDYVVLGPWLGKVDKIVDCVTILYDDGTKSEFTTMGPEKLLPLQPNLLEDSQYPYYPGQRVRIELPNVSRSVRWLCGRGKEKRDEGTVFSVEAGLVYVDWLACAMLGCERGPAPPCVQDSKDLTLLSFPSRANWQLGDWCIFPAADRRGDMERIYLDGSTCDLINGLKQAEEIFLGRTSPNFGKIFVIVKVKTKVDVLWQDGTRSMGLDSDSLFPINAVDAHDFWPDQIVMEKGISDDPGFSSGQRWGFVRWFDAKERTAGVKWNIPEIDSAIELGGEEMEETVSAYELIEHPDYSYYLGDVVFRLEKNQLVDKINGQIWVGEQTIFSSNCSLSCIGIVMGVKEGNVEVKWASGHTTKVAPYEIFRMDKYEALFPIHVPHEENIDPTTEHSTEHDKESLPKGKNLLDSGTASLTRAAAGIFASIMGSLFASLGSTSLSGRSHLNLEKGDGLVCNCEEEAVLESSNLCNEGFLTLGNRNLEQEVKESREAFNQFDMVTGCLDHHFVEGAGEGLALPQVKRGWLKKIQEEWSILVKDLPETIYVRVYEDRMDLLRAAIIGAPGTPYQDGLFFFDIFLPPDYPRVPPLVHYNSGGLRINPNLYESGKVCLSLLNTWTGTGTEVWNPGGSTILQVLLSLQALVLNEKPYYNEAGYDNQMGRAEGEKNSVSYNESAFIGNCKSMLYLLRKPPKHFEEFVQEHFSRRSNNILLACKAYMEGASVGCHFGYTKSGPEDQRGSSTGFKIMLSKLFPKLVEAFSGMGIDCSQYV